MVAYKFYCMGEDGHIVKRHDVDMSDDVTELEGAQEICGDYAIEIWEGARFITHVNHDGSASQFPNPERARERSESS